jgi:hypothetical protein
MSKLSIKLSFYFYLHLSEFSVPLFLVFLDDYVTFLEGPFLKLHIFLLA